MRHKAIPPAYRLVFEFRGIFARVANRLEVTPSIVSRVASGERKAKAVDAALRKEIKKMLGAVGVSVSNPAEFWGVG